MKDMLIRNDGSIQTIEGIPQMIKNRYKTAWELKQKHIMYDRSWKIYLSITKFKFIYGSA